MATTIGIISIGDMGAGIARLLIANGYKVVTNVSGRSEATQTRARNAGVELLDSDEQLVTRATYILSIVPPRDAKATADRIVKAYNSQSTQPRTSESLLYFLELNAIAPSTARSIATLFSSRTPDVRIVDGGIIGGPPKATDPDKSSDTSSWYRPSICLSGPDALPDSSLATLLNASHVGSEIGVASGLKCCFASLTKGYTALAIQSFTTAQRLGVLPQLENYITTHGGAARLQTQQKSLVGMPPKAGRWVEEMREIGRAFQEDGGWDENVFKAVAGVYEFVSEGSVLGQEHVDRRVRGTTAGDVVEALSDGLMARRKRSKSL